MVNVFLDIVKEDLTSKGEKVEESSLACQERGCYLITTEGMYFAEEEVLTWKCTDGHISKLEGFHIG